MSLYFRGASSIIVKFQTIIKYLSTIILLMVMKRLDGRAYENIEIDKLISTYIMIC